jgi:DNA (cytosine-5)-methyltransferase 1
MRARKPRLLDIYCGAGGAGFGYHLAGFDVVGVDVKPQPHYPFELIQGDAIIEAKKRRADFDAFHASPPCQAFTRARKLQDNCHPDLIGVTREFLQSTGSPWCIENVPGAPLINPTLLCGLMFGLNLYRHRLFETSFLCPLILHPPHHAPLAKMGRPVRQGEIIQVVGHFSNVEKGRREMQCPWMSQGELAQAIPPQYTKWIGSHMLSALYIMESGATAYNSPMPGAKPPQICAAQTSA